MGPPKPERRRGVFAKYPAMSPKYHTGNTDESLQYMARLFVPYSQKDLKAGCPTSSIPYASALSTKGTESAGGYIDFLLQQAQESFTEKFEAVDVLSDNYVSYFYGQQPPIFQYSGILLNSKQDDWRLAFMDIYHEFLRGTKMARRQMVVVLAYDDVFVTGVLVSMSQALNADLELAVPFNFQMLVKRYDAHTRLESSDWKPTPHEGASPYSVKSTMFSNTNVVSTKASLYTVSTARFTVTQPAKAEDTSSDAATMYTSSVGYNPEISASLEAESKASDGTYNAIDTISGSDTAAALVSVAATGNTIPQPLEATPESPLAEAVKNAVKLDWRPNQPVDGVQYQHLMTDDIKLGKQEAKETILAAPEE
jgi:hypothetical protein